jgi:uncharacterized protein YjdB
MRRLWKIAAHMGLASLLAFSGFSTVGLGQAKAEEAPAVSKRLMEKLNRAPVAVQTDQGVYVGWRLLGTDSPLMGFNLYRDSVKLNSTPITQSTNYLDPNGAEDSVYEVRPVLSGLELPAAETTRVWNKNYTDIPLRKPLDGRTPVGDAYTYHANDISVGDLDGDSQYELIVKWDPSNSQDNSRSGYTGNVYLDAYQLNGTFLWRIDMGRNIRAGAHYTQFLVYDFDGDGRSEVVAKTADGTRDSSGSVIGDPEADYRNTSGYILNGPEFLTVFDGLTGRAMATVDYDPPRGAVSDWGDGYGNRVDRFLAAVAYLDGERPSIVMTRGYYTRTVLAAYDWRDGQLLQRWRFDTSDPEHSAYAGQGNHNLSVADVDADGKDEIIFGAATIDHDGTGLYNTRLGHGDALHVSDLDPTRPGLEVFKVQESRPSPAGAAMWDARTGELLWGVPTEHDVGRGTAADIDPRYPGAETWAIGEAQWNTTAGGIYTTKGEKISDVIPPANFAIWWDGDLLREILDHSFDESTGVGVGHISKWDYEQKQQVELLKAQGTYSNNSTKGNPGLQADLLGDWREEAIWRLADSSALRLYTTTEMTEHRIYTLMHDPVYRLAIAWQNVGYNQPPHTSYYLGDGMSQPPLPRIQTGLGVGSVSGWVGNGAGKLIRGAQIVLQAGSETYSTVANAHGYYSFHQIPSTRHAVLTASNASCEPGTAVIDVPSNAAIAQDLEVRCDIASITLEPAQQTVLLGNQLQLKAQVTPEDADSKAVQWSSSNPAVASVDSDGLITAMAMGKTTITASSKADAQIQGSSEITVVGVPVEGLDIDKTTVNLLIGTSKQIIATIHPADASMKNLYWQSSNPAVATVDDSGKVTGVAEGSSEITVSTVEGGFSRTAVVHVQKEAVPVASVTLDAPAYYVASDYFSELNPMEKQPTIRLIASVLPSHATNNDVVWESSDTSIATVDSLGYVTGLKSGVAEIKAITVEGQYIATAKVYVPQISESFDNRVVGDAWGSRTGTAGGSGNLGGSVAAEADNHVFRLNGGGSGVRSTQKVFTAPFVSDRVLLDFDWNVGTPNGTPGAQLSIEDSNGQRYLTLQYSPGQEMIYGTGGAAANSVITGAPVGSGFHTNQALYRVRASLDFVKRTIDLSIEDKNNPDVKTNVAAIPFHEGTTYSNNVGKIQFTLVRQSGTSTSWTTWIDNFNVYGMSSEHTRLDSVAIQDSEGNTVDGTVLSMKPGETKQLQTVLVPPNAEVRSIAWSSSDEETATVDADSGLVTAIGPGETEIKVTVEALTAGGSSIISKTVGIQVSAPEPEHASASISGPDEAYAGQPVDLTVQVTGAVYDGFRALDLTFHYDPSKLEFDLEPGASGGFSLAGNAVSSLREGLQVIASLVRPAEGRIRVLMVDVNSEIITADGGVLTLHGRTKADAAVGATTVSLSDFWISKDGDEKEVDVSQASHHLTIDQEQPPVEADKTALSLAISSAQRFHDQAVEGVKLGQYPSGSKTALGTAIATAAAVRDNTRASQHEVDLAADDLKAAVQTFQSQFITMVGGRTEISLGDLSIAVNHYGATSADPNWSSISKADLFDEGEITLRSLVAIARMILADWTEE